MGRGAAIGADVRRGDRAAAQGSQSRRGAWSPRSVTSRWVRAEATLADRQNKLVPAIIEPCDRPIAFELTHTADCRNGRRNSDLVWRGFVKDVQALVQEGRGGGGAAGDCQSTAAYVHPRTPLRAERPAARGALPAAATTMSFSPRGHGTLKKRGARRSEPAPERRQRRRRNSEELHCLRVADGIGARSCSWSGRPGLKIGRTAPADAVIAHPSVSREHCIVGLANDELLVTDLNSTNGTYIDGQRIGAHCPSGWIGAPRGPGFTAAINSERRTRPSMARRATIPRRNTSGPPCGRTLSYHLSD